MPTQVSNNPPVEAQRKTFYHLGLFWYFSDDGSGNIYFRTSPDGSTWSSNNVVASGSGYSNPAIFVDYANNKVYLTWHAGTTVYFKLGTLNSDGTITWGSTETVGSVSEYSADRQNIWVDNSGTIWVVVYGYWASTSEPWYLFKKPSGGSWALVTYQYDNRPTQLSVFVLDNGKIVVVRTCDGFGSADNYLRVWVSADGGSSWSSYTYSTYYILHHCALVIGNIVHISFIDKVNWDVYYIRFDGTTNSFSTAVKLWDDNSSIRTTISKDKSNNLYVFWNRDSTSGAILMYKKSNDGGNTWSPATTVASSTDTTDQDERFTTEYIAYNGKISIYYLMDGKTWFAYISAGVQYSLSLTDSISLADSVVKQSSRTLSDSLSLSDVVAKQTQKAFSESFSLSDSLVKQPTKVLSESLVLSELVFIHSSTGQNVCFLTDSFGLSDTIAKQSSRTLSDTISLSDTITKHPSKVLSDSISLSDVILRGIILTDTISLSDSLTKHLSRLLSDGISLSDIIAKQTSRLLTDSFSLSDSLLRGRVLVDTISLSDSLTKQTSKFLTEHVIIYDLFSPISPRFSSKSRVIPYVTPEGKLLQVRYWTLDQLMFGFILGVSKLGYGVLFPKSSTFQLPEGKKNPEFLNLIIHKIYGTIDRLSLLPWVYGQYNKPEEMMDVHKSERTAQYDLLQTQRRVVEDWVRNRLAKYRLDAMSIRQYQNAVLQAIGWKSKRHPWGFKPFKDTPEDQFKAFWIDNWKAQGLDENILRELYDSLEYIIQAIRDTKTTIGEKVGQTRRRLAGGV